MSVIKVNKLENTNTTAGGVEVDSSGHVQVDGLQMPTTGALSNRNLITNGEQKVDQRNGGSSVTLSSTAAFVTDRWSAKINGGAATAEQDTTVPSGKGFTKSLKFDVTTADTSLGAGDEVFVQTKIEAQDLTQLSHGSPDAQSVTFSFWVKSALTGNYGLYIYKGDTGRAYQTTYNISAANTWEYKTITVPGDTSGAIPADNGVGFELRWYLAIGTDKGGSLNQNAWGTDADNRHPTGTNLMASTSNDWFVTGVQLEVGEKATEFSHEPFSVTLARCQRYYIDSRDNKPSDHIVIGQAINSGRIGASVFFPQSMRENPSITIYSPNETAGKVAAYNNTSVDIGSSFTGVTTKNSGFYYVHGGSGLTTSNWYAFKYSADAEL